MNSKDFFLSINKQLLLKTNNTLSFSSKEEERIFNFRNGIRAAILGASRSNEIEFFEDLQKFYETTNVPLLSMESHLILCKNFIRNKEIFICLNYLNTNKPLKADIITVPNQFTFTGASILNPPTGSQLPATTINNFVIYVNGQYVPSAFASITNVIGNVTMQVNTGSIGYSLETDDEVIAIGKFT